MTSLISTTTKLNSPGVFRAGVTSHNSNAIGRKVKSALAAAVLGAVLVAGLGAAPAQAYEVFQSGSPGGVYEGTGFVHCGVEQNGALKVGIEGLQTWASQATGDSQIVQAEAFLYKWNGSRWALVGTDGPSRAWTRVGYGPVSFGHSVWTTGHGSFTINLRVRWFTASGALLGTKVIQPNAAYDFTANQASGGRPGYCNI
jgi:hypothetical protein